MKKLFTLLMFIVTVTIAAQAPQGFNYQATVRNNAGVLIINKSVSFKFNIIPTSASGTAVYSESQTVTTDDLGQVSLVIGKGTATTGTFATIDWSTGTYYLGIELNTGNGFVGMGTTQLLSVPYALFAKSAGTSVAPNLANVLAKNNSANATKITNLADPTDTQDATTKKYVDAADTAITTLADGKIYVGNDSNQATEVALSGDVTINNVGVTKIGASKVTTETIASGAITPIKLADNAVESVKIKAAAVTNVKLDKVNIPLSGFGAATADVALGGKKLTGVADPIDAQDATTKSYVDSRNSMPVGTEKGQILYWDGNKWDKLSPGKTGNILRSSDGTPTWENSSPKLIIKDYMFTFISNTQVKLTIKSALVNNGGEEINEQGICYSRTNNKPTTSDLTEKNQNMGDYSKISTVEDSFGRYYYNTIDNLVPGTKYYINSYGKNSIGTAYSDVLTITTPTNNILPTISTLEVSNIQSNLASLNGKITVSQNINPDISSSGFVWSISRNPTILLSTKTNNRNYILGSITNTISGLLPSTTYYVRTYATNALGTTYGNEISFQTLAATKPEISYSSIQSIKSNSVSIYAYITNDGGSEITSSGMVWSTSPNPTTALNTKINSTSQYSIYNTITGLSPNTTYYIKAFAINALGTSYGEEHIITTPVNSVPKISNPYYSSITTNSLYFSSSVSDDGGLAVTEKGIVWSTSTNPTTSLSSKFVTTTNSSSIYNSINGLTPNTTYYIKAYATNALGTSYGNEISITTLPLSTPKVSSTNYYSTTSNSVSCYASITDNGGLAILSNGLVWSTATNPTIDLTTKMPSTNTSNINNTITGLLPSTTYYIKAYATNALGTSYGNEISIKTLANSAPIFSNSSIQSITSTLAYFNASLSSNGGSEIISSGFVLNTSPNPTPNLNSKIVYTNNSSSNYLNKNISELLPSTTYYVRAFAINAFGTGYGAELSFTTLANLIPVFEDYGYIDGIQRLSTYIYSYLRDGESNITERGYVWSTSPNPTTSLSTKISEWYSLDDAFGRTISPLLPSTTYYIRPYAINSAGTGYGKQMSFTTLNLTVPTIKTAPVSSLSATNGTSGGYITDDGGLTISARGLVWSTSRNPTTSVSTKTTNGSGTGLYTSSLTNLTSSTTYYVRAYATNAAGTAYGNEQTFTTP
jgi:hypothetical protein